MFKIIKKLKTKFYHKKIELLKKYSKDYRKLFKLYEDAKMDGIVIIKDDKFYALNCSTGKIYFNISDRNLDYDIISNAIKNKQYGVFDEAIKLLDFVGNCDTILDIGANLGIFAFPFARKGTKVYGFEANNLNWQQLVKTAEFNKFDCKFYNYAIVDKSGNYVFYPSGPWGFLANNFISGEEDKKEIIEGLSIDDWHKEHNIAENIDLIKMDIEGSELKALEGMKEFLKVKNYPPFYVEANIWCMAWSNINTKQFVDEFKELGYKPYFIKAPNTVEEFNSDFQLKIVEDFLMVHKDNTKIIDKKKIESSPIYTPEVFFNYIEKLNCANSLTHEEAYGYAFMIKNNKHLLKSKLLNRFMKMHKEYSEEHNKKIHSDLINLMREVTDNSLAG